MLRNIGSVVLMSMLVFCQGWMSEAYANNGQGQGQGQGQGLGKGQGQGKIKIKANKQGLGSTKQAGKAKAARFVRGDKAIITKYFSATPFPVTTLPPGIAKNLLRGKPLPPGIAKVFLPSDLISRLPVYPGYDYLLVGRDAVLVNTTTGIVADILTNVLQ